MTTDRRRVLACLVLLTAVGCRPGADTGAANTHAADGLAIKVQPWALPTAAGASEPSLSVTPRGSLLLSWVQTDGAAKSLRFSQYSAGRWSPPRTVATRADGFGNPADTPHLATTADGTLWAQWLRKSEAGGYARDVVLTNSRDGGATWRPPVAVNIDGTPTEHGFVSLWPASATAVHVAWLDGRAKASGHMSDGAHQEGMTMLRAATFDKFLRRTEETSLDASVCDCCSTDVAPVADGAVLVYRNRTADETRDIASVRLHNGKWDVPAMVHDDHWTMPACPVNGPAVAATEHAVAAAWYTAAGGQSSIRTAFSNDGGRRFATPVVVDSGDAVLGHADVAMTDRAAWVTWHRQSGAHASLWVSRLRSGAVSKTADRTQVAILAGSGRAIGVPRLVAAGPSVYLVWTDLEGRRPALRGAVMH